MGLDPYRVLGHFESRSSEMIAAIRRVVDIESPSRNAAQSRAVADLIEHEAYATGADIQVERIAVEHGDHLIIRAFAGPGRPTLLLGHTDTVHPIGSAAKNPTRIERDRFYGCGIFDMKSGIILMLEALRYFAETKSSPAAPITILLSCDEEIGSLTGRPLVEREAAASRRCLVFEPSSAGMIKTGRKGTGMFTVRAHGKPAHAGLEPEKGANAVAELARQVDRIHSIARADEGTTVNVTTFRGGTTTNVIPDQADCEIDVRFKTRAEGERVDHAIRQLNSFDAAVTLEVLGGVNRPPLERTPDVAAFYQEASTVAASFEYELGETQVGGASDANFVAPLGVPVLDGLGITGADAHMLTEHILISDIAKRATLVTLLLAGS